MSKREWRVVVKEHDAGRRLTICVGMYRDGKSVCRISPRMQEIDPDAGATGEQIAGMLEDLAGMMIHYEKEWV